MMSNQFYSFVLLVLILSQCFWSHTTRETTRQNLLGSIQTHSERLESKL